ncbi:hypothetical protein Tco_0793550 [Tanacetum coccineum]
MVAPSQILLRYVTRVKCVYKYKVIDLYADHSVCKVPMNVDHSVSKAFMLIEPNNLDDFMDNDADDVLDDVSEDEWLQDALRKVSRLSQSVGQLMTYPPLQLEGLLFELERNLLPNIPRNL